MGIILGIAFIVTLGITLFGLFRAKGIIVQGGHSKPLFLSVSLALSICVLLVYFFTLKQTGKYNAFGAYLTLTLYYIAGPTILAIILSFVKHPKAKVAGMILSLYGAIMFLIVNLWSFVGPKLSVFGLEHYN